MKIIRITLQNICQHRSLDWELQDGFIGVIGHNGDGKSNALNAAYAALSGDFSRHSLGKAGYVNQLADAGEPSTIEVCAEHGGTTFSVFRSLTQAKQYLVVGNQTYTKANDIKQVLEEVLGITPALLDAYVFVAQWRLFSFIDTPAERAKQFSQLCQTTKSEQLWKLLGAQIDLDRSIADQVLDNSDELTQMLTEYQQQLGEITVQIVAAEKGLLPEKQTQTLEAIVRQAAEATRLQVKLPGLQTRTSELLAAAKTAVSEWKQAVAAAEPVAESLPGLQEAATVAREQLAMRAAYETSRAMYERLRASLDALQAPVEPEALDELTVEELDKQIMELMVESERLTELLSNCADTPNCPTCGTATNSPELGKRIRAAEQRMPGLQDERTGLQRRKQIRKAYDQKQLAYAAALQSYNKQRASLTSQLTAAKLGDAPDVDEAQCKQAVAKEAGTRQLHAKLQAAVTAAVQAKEAAKAKHQAAKATLEAAQQELAAITVTQEQLDDAEARLVAHKAADRELAALEQRERSAIDTIRNVEKQLQILSNRKERSGKARRWVDVLEQARAVLHRSALPALVHQTALEDLTDRINEALERFNSRFYVTATEDLDMLAHFQNGVVSRVADLSGGQKMVFALTFRLAVNATFAGQIGMMVLDEPTACVDEQNVERMVDVFAALGQEAKQKGHQIIVVTHEEQLRPVFDQVLRVPEAM